MVIPSAPARDTVLHRSAPKVGAPAGTSQTPEEEGDYNALFQSLLTPEQRAKLDAADSKDHGAEIRPRKLKYTPGTALCALCIVLGAVWTTVLAIKVCSPC